MSTSSDASIPVLTQIIGTLPKTNETVKPSVPPIAVERKAQPGTGEEWRALELKLNERVLRQILRRVDFVIEHRVKESLASILQASTDELVKEIRRGLQATMEDVVTRAVAQEIARVQAIKD